jgi:hypothetical protein
VRHRERERGKDQAAESVAAAIPGAPLPRAARVRAAFADTPLDVVTQADTRFTRPGQAELDCHSDYS